MEAQNTLNVQTCSPTTPTDMQDHVSVQLVDTNEFDTYRTGRLASMTLDIVLQTYTAQDTIVLTYTDTPPNPSTLP
ncbi:hypothetical protein EON63_19775, partial [archaeon]